MVIYISVYIGNFLRGSFSLCRILRICCYFFRSRESKALFRLLGKAFDRSTFVTSIVMNGLSHKMVHWRLLIFPSATSHLQKCRVSIAASHTAATASVLPWTMVVQSRSFSQCWAYLWRCSVTPPRCIAALKFCETSRVYALGALSCCRWTGFVCSSPLRTVSAVLQYRWHAP